MDIKMIKNTYKKRVLFIVDYFVPEVSAIGQLLHELCIALTPHFEVAVIAMKANSDGIITRLFDVEEFDGIKVYRIRTKKVDKMKKLSRIRHVIEFFIKAFIVMLNTEKYNIIFSTTQPPVLSGLLGLLYKIFKRGKFIYNIQDFNPEQTEAVGFVKSKHLINLVRNIDSLSCRFADKIILVGRDMFHTLERRGICVDGKCLLINNWADDDTLKPIENEEVQRFRYKIAGNAEKVIMYSGNLGLYYDLENIIKVIEKFKDNSKVVFVIIGNGATKPILEEYVNYKKMTNVRFFPHQPKSLLPITINSADIHIVSSQKGIKGVSVPSKLYGIMAAGKAVLGIVEEGSEPWYLINESKCGFTIEPQDYIALKNKIYNLIQTDLSELKRIGMNGRFYLDKYLKKELAIKNYTELFSSM
ncbi:MAG: glycosyltransferase family 4 protein [Clostridia bacterium]|nr:glycosyltransferase family 4 protein [Clostridia bacterium]